MSDFEASTTALTPSESLMETWAQLAQSERVTFFRGLSSGDAEDVFLALNARDQATLFEEFTRPERKLWIRFLAPDDATDLVQELPEDIRAETLGLVDETARREIIALLSYREDEAGGLMSPRFARVRPEMLVAEAIRYVRQQAQIVDPIHYIYVLDSHQKILGVLSLRKLFVSPGEKKISEVMDHDPVSVPDEMDQEQVSRIFSQHRFVALPVVDSEGRMHGVVTVDDILDVVREEATEDMQKLGGSEALDQPYNQISFLQMVKKRAGWLTILFLGEMLTATVMGHFADEISHAVVLALFLPLIISSGGNSGSQATSIIIRALALREISQKDWWRVLGRECAAGLTLGLILGFIGMCRIMLWPMREHDYGVHYPIIALTVAVSLIGVVLWGSVAGSILPFVLRRFGFDPAAASAPFVATLVDVTGLVIYFTVAKLILSGILL